MKIEDPVGTPVPVPYNAEHRHERGGVLLEVRRYFCLDPMDLVVRTSSAALTLNLALSARPLHTRVDPVDPAPTLSAADAGRLLVMIPGKSYRLSLTQGSLRSLHCAINRERFEAIVGEAIDWLAIDHLGEEARRNLNLDALLLRIYEELVGGRVGREELIEASIQTIVVELVRQFRLGSRARPDVYSGGLAAWRMRKIVDRIRADGPAPRVTELAQLCELTERQLSRAFKAETGVTIGRHVDEATAERAYRLLTSTDQPIAAIARELGFASAQSFAQAYRRITGYSPSKLRERSGRARHPSAL